MFTNTSTAIPKKEFIVDYNIEKVKIAINEIADAVRPLDTNGFYKNSKGMNPLFGLYTFNIDKQDNWAGLVTGNMDVQVEEVENQKTKIIINAIQNTPGTLVASKIVEIENHFLKLLSARLTGEKTVQELAPAKQEIPTISIVLIVVIVIMIILIASCK